MAWLRKLGPDSLYGQLLVAMFLGAAVLQGINLYAVCYIQHSYNNEVHKVRFDYNSSIFMALQNMAPDQRELFLKGLSRSQASLSQPFQFVISSQAPKWDSDQSAVALEAAQSLEKALRAGGAVNFSPVMVRVLEKSNPAAAHPFYQDRNFPLIQMVIQMDDHSWLKITQPLLISNRSAVWRQRLFLFLGTLSFALVVLLLIRRATRPLSRLGQAAESFGRNPEIVQPLTENGSRELREAAQSFNLMRERIRGNLNERNRMLEAMGHDLRTPLARIQLRLEKIKPELLKDQFAANINEIQSIIEQGLELAKSLHTSEKPVPLDIVAFTQSIVDDIADQGQDIALQDLALNEPPDNDGQGPILVMGRPTCLRRCLENLIVNAVNYGLNARLAISQPVSGQVALDVLDQGPGIPEDLLDKVFEPYYRLEGSRNRESGGTGLGLSIARNMVLLNNGTLNLSNRPEGGLRARLTLPTIVS